MSKLNYLFLLKNIKKTRLFFLKKKINRYGYRSYKFFKNVQRKLPAYCLTANVQFSIKAKYLKKIYLFLTFYTNLFNKRNVSLKFFFIYIKKFMVILMKNLFTQRSSVSSFNNDRFYRLMLSFFFIKKRLWAKKFTVNQLKRMLKYKKKIKFKKFLYNKTILILSTGSIDQVEFTKILLKKKLHMFKSLFSNQLCFKIKLFVQSLKKYKKFFLPKLNLKKNNRYFLKFKRRRRLDRTYFLSQFKEENKFKTLGKYRKNGNFRLTYLRKRHAQSFSTEVDAHPFTYDEVVKDLDETFEINDEIVYSQRLFFNRKTGFDNYFGRLRFKNFFLEKSHHRYLHKFGVLFLSYSYFKLFRYSWLFLRHLKPHRRTYKLFVNRQSLKKKILKNVRFRMLATNILLSIALMNYKKQQNKKKKEINDKNAKKWVFVLSLARLLLNNFLCKNRVKSRNVNSLTVIKILYYVLFQKFSITTFDKNQLKKFVKNFVFNFEKLSKLDLVKKHNFNAYSKQLVLTTFKKHKVIHMKIKSFFFKNKEKKNIKKLKTAGTKNTVKLKNKNKKNTKTLRTSTVKTTRRVDSKSKKSNGKINNKYKKNIKNSKVIILKKKKFLGGPSEMFNTHHLLFKYLMRVCSKKSYYKFLKLGRITKRIKKILLLKSLRSGLAKKKFIFKKIRRPRRFKKTRRLIKKKDRKFTMLKTSRMYFWLSWAVENWFSKKFNIHSHVKIVNSDQFLDNKKALSTIRSWGTLRKYTKQLRHKKLIFSIINLSFYRQPNLLVLDIVDEFRKNKKHWSIIRTVQDIMSRFFIPNMQTWRLLINGKINNIDRAKGYIYHEVGANVPLCQTNKQVIQASAGAWAKTGVFGFRLWFYYLSDGIDG